MKMSDVFALPVYSGTQDVAIHNKEKPCVVSGTSTVLVARTKYIEATIYAINNHDRLTEENAKLREALGSVIESIKNSDDSIVANIDFLPFIKADLLVNQLKDQNNDK